MAFFTPLIYMKLGFQILNHLYSPVNPFILPHPTNLIHPKPISRMLNVYIRLIRLFSLE